MSIDPDLSNKILFVTVKKAVTRDSSQKKRVGCEKWGNACGRFLNLLILSYFIKCNAETKLQVSIKVTNINCAVASESISAHLRDNI